MDSCLRGLENEPTLVEILVAAYVLNGGVSLKFHTQTEQQEEDERDLDALLHHIEGSFRDVWADSAEKKMTSDYGKIWDALASPARLLSCLLSRVGEAEFFL